MKKMGAALRLVDGQGLREQVVPGLLDELTVRATTTRLLPRHPEVQALDRVDGVGVVLEVAPNLRAA